MAGFTGKPELTELAPLNNNGFWPALSMAELVHNYRIPTEYDNGVIETGLMVAMIRVNEKLERIQLLLQTNTYDSLNDYEADNSSPINNGELISTFYVTAVFCRAKAQLLKSFPTINRREIAQNEAKESDQTEMYWLDESQKNIAALMRHFFPGETFIENHGVHVNLI